MNVRRPAIRERVARAEWPNFRDDRGGSIATPLLRLLQNLQRGHAEAWASEAGLRQMICEDTGHMPGVGSVPATLNRLQSEGRLEQVHILPGSLLPTGQSAHHGTRGIHVAVNRSERQAIRARNKHRRHRERRVLRSVELAREALQKAATPRKGPPNKAAALSSPGEDERRVDALRRLAELARKWESEPPDKS